MLEFASVTVVFEVVFVIRFAEPTRVPATLELEPVPDVVVVLTELALVLVKLLALVLVELLELVVCWVDPDEELLPVPDPEPILGWVAPVIFDVPGVHVMLLDVV